MIPYHRPLITDEEIAAVTETLRSGWLTAGKKVDAFENAFREFKGPGSAIAVNSCTSALFLLLHSLDLGPGDEVITTPLTFVATVNTILHTGAEPVLADVDSATWNISVEEARKKITDRTKAIVCVHLGGNPCDMDGLMELCREYDLHLIEDCAHAIEGAWKKKPLGTFGYGSAFSFYPTKNITAAEGGMIFIPGEDSEAIISKLKRLRRHGVDFDAWQRESSSDYRFYDVLEPGFKMNMTDIQAAIGLCQLAHVKEWHGRRKEIVKQYDEAFAPCKELLRPQTETGAEHAHHLYLLKLTGKKWAGKRNALLKNIQEGGVQVSVNYTPVHLFSWYRRKMGFSEGDFPVAEEIGAHTFSLPLYPGLTDEEVKKVAAVVREALA